MHLDKIYDDLVDSIDYRAGPKTVKVDFDWQQNSLITQRNFTGKNQQHQNVLTLEEYALFSFAHGKVVEDGHGGDSHEVFALKFTVVSCF